MNVIVFIVFVCESYLSQKNPQPAPLSRSVWITPSLLHSVYENSQLQAQTSPATGVLESSPNAGSLGWIWIVSRMSSWINMAIYFKLKLHFLVYSSSAISKSDSPVCFQLGLSGTDVVAVKQQAQIHYRGYVFLIFPSMPHCGKKIRCCQNGEHQWKKERRRGDYVNQMETDWLNVVNVSCEAFSFILQSYSNRISEWLFFPN